MKKILFLLSLLVVIGCHKDDLILEPQPKEETNTDQLKEESKEPAEPTTPEDPVKPEEPIVPENPKESETPEEVKDDPTLSKEEKTFHRLMNSCLRMEEDCNVDNLNIVLSGEGLSSEHKAFYNNFLKKHPFIFHLQEQNTMIVILKTPNQLEKYQFEYTVPKNQLANWFSRLEKAYEEFYSCLREGMSDAEIALALHLKLIQKTSYSEPEHASDILGPLVNGKAVCKGYSLAYCKLMEGLGISTDYVCGPMPNDARGHMWNRIKLDGSWYNLDATWDDSESSNVSFFPAGYFLTSDHVFENKCGHPRPYSSYRTVTANSERFETYFFRKNNMNDAAYVDGYWYYISQETMQVCKSRFDGTEKKVLRQLARSKDDSSLWKQIAFGADKIYFTDRIGTNDYVCTIGYDGCNFEQGRQVEFWQLTPGTYKLKRDDNDILPRKEVGTIALRAEVFLSKLKNAYYHGAEDYYKPENQSRVALVKTIEEAEKLLQSKTHSAVEAKALYDKLHNMRKNYSMPISSYTQGS